MIGPTIRIARFFGIPIRIDVTWILVFGLFVFFVSRDFFRPLFPAAGYWGQVGLAALTIFLFFVSVLLHELAHSLVAITNGLKVKAIALFILGGVSQLEAEPQRPWVEFWMALAGPVVSLLIGLGCGWLCLVLGAGELVPAYLGGEARPPPVSAAAAVLFWLALQNLALFLFNIIPGFPLDGGRMVRAFIWGVSRNYSLATRAASWLGRGIGYVFLVLGLYSLFLGGFSGIWLLLIGWFLLGAARVGLGQAAVREMLAGYEVGQFIQPQPIIVPGQLTLELLVQEYVGRQSQSLYPVRQANQIAGVVTRALVQQVPTREWAERRVSEAMAALGPEYVVGPQTPAQEAFDRMGANQTGSILVMEGDSLLGLASQREMLRLVRILPPARPFGPAAPPLSVPPSDVPPDQPPASADPAPPYERFGS